MAIIATASDSSQFTSTFGPLAGTSTDPLRYDDRLCRSGLFFPASVGSLGILPLPTGTTSAWMHFTLYIAGTATSNAPIMNFMDTSGTTYLAGLFMTANSFGAQEYGIQIGGVLQAGTTFTLSPGTHTFDINYVRGAAGLVEIFVDDSLRVTFSGNTQVNVNDTAFFQYRHPASNNVFWVLSEILIDDSVSTIGKRLATLSPTAGGTYNEWTGTFADIDEIGDVTTGDFISTETLNARFTANYSNLHTDFINYAVDAVEIPSVQRLSPTSAVNDIQHMLREGGVDHVTANLGVTNNNALQQHSSLFTLNPITGLPWTRTEVDGLEIGVKAV